MVAAAPEEAAYPAGVPAGAHHTVTGTIQGVKCSYPSVLALTVAGQGKPIKLYTNNYFKILIYGASSDVDVEINPCTGINGMKASIDFGEVTDERVAGQILKISLMK